MRRNDRLRRVVYERWKKDKRFKQRATARELDIHRSTVRRWIKLFESGEVPKEVDVRIKDRRNGIPDRRKTVGGGGIAAFRNMYDDSIKIPKIIDEGIDKYLVNGKGEPDWMYDRLFREKCGVPPNKWRRYADDYKHLQVTARGEVVWGHPNIINEMREILLR